MAREAQAQAGPDILAWAPLVKVQDREDWEAYAATHATEWIEQSWHFFLHHQTESLQHDSHDEQDKAEDHSEDEEDHDDDEDEDHHDEHNDHDEDDHDEANHKDEHQEDHDEEGHDEDHDEDQYEDAQDEDVHDEDHDEDQGDESSWGPIHPRITTLPGWEPLDHEDEKHRSKDEDEHHHDLLDGYHAPLWQMGGSAVDTSGINLDLLTHPTFRRLVAEMLETRQAVLSEAINLTFLDPHKGDEGHDEHDEDSRSEDDHAEEEDHAEHAHRNRRRRRLSEQDDEDHHTDELDDHDEDEHEGDIHDKSNGAGLEHDVHEPHAFMLYPIFSDLESGSSISGFVIAVFPMGLMFKSQGLIHDMVAVLSDSCGYDYTYHIELDGEKFLHSTDSHDRHYDHLSVHAELDILLDNTAKNHDHDLIHDAASHTDDHGDWDKCYVRMNLPTTTFFILS